MKIPNSCRYVLALSGKFPAPAVPLEVVDGLPVVHMEMVTCAQGWNQANEWERSNPWINNLHDGRQVGKLKDGRVVVYDFGFEDGYGLFSPDAQA